MFCPCRKVREDQPRFDGNLDLSPGDKVNSEPAAIKKNLLVEE